MSSTDVLVAPSRQDVNLVKAPARSFPWRRMLEGSEFGTVRKMAKAKKFDETYIRRALRLTLLAPNMVEAIQDGRQPEEVTLPALMEWVGVEWGSRG